MLSGLNFETIALLSFKNLPLFIPIGFGCEPGDFFKQVSEVFHIGITRSEHNFRYTHVCFFKRVFGSFNFEVFSNKYFDESKKLLVTTILYCLQ